MNETELGSWLERYGRAWEESDPDAAAALFSQDASYYETPFGAPAQGREGVRAYWANATRNQADISFSYEILSVAKGRGIACWRAGFTRRPSAARVTLDGIFLLEFDDDGLCRELREWWHVSEETPE